MKTKLTNLLLILSLILILTSCNNSADVERAVETFFVFVIQIISFILFGISSLTLCIVGASSKTNTLKIIGGILLGIFSLITIICFMMITEINPKRDFIYFAFVVDVVLIGLALFFLTKSKKVTQQATQLSNAALDKIIEAEEIKAPPLIQDKKKDESDNDEMEMI